MSKRLKLCCEDRIGDLPDELLVKILSLLTLKEAGQSSILSRRWKMLWTCKTGNLEFPNPAGLSRFQRSYDLQIRQNERDKYSNWVNQVLKSHQGPMIDLFKVCFDLDNDYKFHLDNWIQFALRKKTLNLVFDLNPNKTTQENTYSFSREIFSSIQSNLEILRSLQLQGVDVSGHVLADILSNCTSLEALSISGSNSLVDTRFCGPLKLKFIAIRRCKGLKTIQISAANLECLVCCGEKDTSLVIQYAPKLRTLYLGGGYCRSQYPLFPELSSVLSRIHTLVLDCTASIWSGPVSQFPQLKNIKWLELKMPASEVHSLLYCMTMVKACPMLERFGVEFDWKLPRCAFTRQMSKIELEEKLECLKIVEFSWFSARTTDVELVTSLLDNAPNVKTVIFDTHYPDTTSNLFAHEIDSDEHRPLAKNWARHLANTHCPNAYLIVR